MIFTDLDPVDKECCKNCRLHGTAKCYFFKEYPKDDCWCFLFNNRILLGDDNK